MGCVPSRVRRFSVSNYLPINPVFGVPLINVLCSEKSPYVARIVVDCVEIIERDENITKNVYSASRPQSVRHKINRLRRKVFESRISIRIYVNVFQFDLV